MCVWGGALIGSAATSMLLLTQPKWTMCAIEMRNFYGRLIATSVGCERKKHKKKREGTAERTPFLPQYSEDMQSGCETISTVD